MAFWECVQYLVITGIIAFFVGRIMPKKWFCPNSFPYRSFRFEQDGKFYHKFKIHYWQSKLPDMSKILPNLMPAKDLSGNYAERLPEMIQETCMAEFIHIVLCFTGCYCFELWPGIGGFMVVILYIGLFNLPYIMIQRYNRPRLMKLTLRLKKEYVQQEEHIKCESV